MILLVYKIFGVFSIERASLIQTSYAFNIEISFRWETNINAILHVVFTSHFCGREEAYVNDLTKNLNIEKYLGIPLTN